MRHGSSDYRERLLRELVCSPSVVAVWDFYCPSGTVIRDQKGTNHLTLQGSPTRGGALRVGNGSIAAPTTSDYATAADSTSLTLGDGPMTHMAWATRDSDSGGNETIWGKGAAAWAHGILSTDKYGIAKPGTTFMVDTVASIPADGLVHSFASRRSQQGVNLTDTYFDGLVDRTTIDESPTLANNSNVVEFLREGAAQRWVGKLAVGAIWARKLEPSEIRYFHLLAFGG